MPPVSGAPTRKSSVSGKLNDWWDGGRDFLEGLGWVKPKPLPRCHKDNKHYENLPKSKDAQGYKYYEVPETWLGQDVNGDGVIGSRDPEDIVLIWEGWFKEWYFEDQVKSYSNDIQLIESEINAYEDEIREINKHIADKKRKNLKAEMNTADLTEKINDLSKDIDIRLNGGATETDVDIIALRDEIKALEAQLKIHNVNNKYHITDWRVDPYSTVIEEKNLYTLRSSHKSHIRHLSKGPLKVRKNQLFLSAWHLRRHRRWMRRNFSF